MKWDIISLIWREREREREKRELERDRERNGERGGERDIPSFNIDFHLQSPMVQQSMQHMMNNPQLMEQMLRNSPLLAGNPQAAEMVGVASGWSQ